LSTVQRLLKQQRRRSVRPGHWPAGMPGRQAVTPVSQSQGFIPVWPLAVIAHGKYHYCAQFTVRAHGEYNCRYKNYSFAVACHRCISTVPGCRERGSRPRFRLPGADHWGSSPGYRDRIHEV